MNLETRSARTLFCAGRCSRLRAVDEARTPLIISGAGEMLDGQYLIADQFVKALRKDEVEAITRNVRSSTEKGTCMSGFNA
ncbi:MAG: hypothetical protein ACLVJ6_02825 [Merdibacter sp.]